ncbi:MAG: cupin domain-containing protein [Dehalococcoidia bacterium]|nr:cupin domain-containing protein [Dehalococcoidia bacterium]
MTTTNKTAAKVFTYVNEEILAGTGDCVLPGSGELSGVVKRYAEGGENKMHCHPTEDHTFFVLEGKATFRIDSDENLVVVGEREGVYLPKGTNYWFLSSGEKKLIMIRVGTEQGSDRIIDGEIVKSTRATADRAPVRELPF